MCVTSNDTQQNSAVNTKLVMQNNMRYLCVSVCPCESYPVVLKQTVNSCKQHCTHRKQHDGDGQSDGGQNSQSDEQQQGVKLINLGEGVEQLRLHVVCGEGKPHNTYDSRYIYDLQTTKLFSPTQI